MVYCGVLWCTVCYEHKKVGKGDQIGGNSVLTTDGETQVQELDCAFAAKKNQTSCCCIMRVCSGMVDIVQL